VQENVTFIDIDKPDDTCNEDWKGNCYCDEENNKEYSVFFILGSANSMGETAAGRRAWTTMRRLIPIKMGIQCGSAPFSIAPNPPSTAR